MVEFLLLAAALWFFHAPVWAYALLIAISVKKDK